MLGDTAALRTLLADAQEPELRASLLDSLLHASTDAWHVISYDVGILSTLNAWLDDLLEEQRSFHIIELILKVWLLLNT